MESEFPEIQEEIVDAINEGTLENGESRIIAWSLLLGTRYQDKITHYNDFYHDLLTDAFDAEKNTEDDLRV